METIMTKEQAEKWPAKGLAVEFGSWPMNAAQGDVVNEIKWKFDDLLSTISNRTAPYNSRYLSIVKTKLEEACMFAVKGIAKPNLD